MSGFQSRSVFKNAYRSDIIRLVVICGGLYVFLGFTEVIFKLSDGGTAFFLNYIKNPLMLPLTIPEFLAQPWSLFTYGFMSPDFWGLFTNMLWLWIFGSIIEDQRGINRVLPIFWLGFIVAGTCLLLYYTIQGHASHMYMSTLAGVTAVAAAAITYKPVQAFYTLGRFSIPISILGIIFLLISLLFNWGDMNAIISLVAGGLLGFLSQNILSSFFENLRTGSARLRSYFSSNENFLKTSRSRKVVLSELDIELNRLLDRLNTLGLENMTEREIELLKKNNLY